uniref:Plakophilin 4 n=3 Tax=Ovis aries TaxID=9940 RepID=A0AC11ELS4_SHEEP
MPAPEQASLVEEGQPQTRQEAASTGPGMEPETTATTILASVKEQVPPLILDFAINLFFIAFKN